VALPASVRLVTVLRGPFLVPPDDALVLRVDDVLVMVGLQADLAQVAAEFTQARSAKPA
jgi:Trk K+ transport system NAD-binding subunit